MADATAIRAQIDSLKAVRNSGVISVRSDNDTTQFRSLQEIDQAIAALEVELAETTGVPRVRRPRYVTQFGKGY